MSGLRFTRREALGGFRSLGNAGPRSAFLREQDTKETLPPRRPPRGELVNALEFEDVAKLVLPAAAYATVAGGDRRAFDRIIFRPRMLVPTVDLDLSVELFGQQHVAPILVGPVAEQRRYHPEGELATVRGASAARAGVIISSRSSVSIGEIASETKAPLWYSVYADSNANTQKQVQQAVAAGCKAVCMTVGAVLEGNRASRSRVDWKAIDQIRRGLDVPIVVKGVMTTADAKTAIEQGARGIVVSDHGVASGTQTPIEILPSIVDLVNGRAAVLIDGSFRRGTDILKALVLGAHAVLVARPVMWGLSAYGAEGVQSVIELLQTTLGRNMGTIGALNLKSLTRSMVKVHPAQP